MRNHIIIFILIFAGSYSKLYGEVDTMWNTIRIENLDLKRNKLILLPMVKGGGERAYLFETDNETLGLVYFSWGSKPGSVSRLTRAYKWKWRRWWRVGSNLIKSENRNAEKHTTFSGDFSNLNDICLLFDRENQTGQSYDDRLQEIINGHGLVIKRIRNAEHRKYLIRSFVLAVGKYIIYFVVIIILIRFYGRRLLNYLKR